MVYIPIKIANFMQMAENGLKSQVFEKILQKNLEVKKKCVPLQSHPGNMRK